MVESNPSTGQSRLAAHMAAARARQVAAQQKSPLRLIGAPGHEEFTCDGDLGSFFEAPPKAERHSKLANIRQRRAHLHEARADMADAGADPPAQARIRPAVQKEAPARHPDVKQAQPELPPKPKLPNILRHEQEAAEAVVEQSPPRLPPEGKHRKEPTEPLNLSLGFLAKPASGLMAFGSGRSAQDLGAMLPTWEEVLLGKDVVATDDAREESSAVAALGAFHDDRASRPEVKPTSAHSKVVGSAAAPCQAELLAPDVTLMPDDAYEHDSWHPDPQLEAQQNIEGVAAQALDLNELHDPHPGHALSQASQPRERQVIELPWSVAQLLGTDQRLEMPWPRSAGTCADTEQLLEGVLLSRSSTSPLGESRENPQLGALHEEVDSTHGGGDVGANLVDRSTGGDVGPSLDHCRLPPMVPQLHLPSMQLHQQHLELLVGDLLQQQGPSQSNAPGSESLSRAAEELGDAIPAVAPEAQPESAPQCRDVLLACDSTNQNDEVAPEQESFVAGAPEVDVNHPSASHESEPHTHARQVHERNSELENGMAEYYMRHFKSAGLELFVAVHARFGMSVLTALVPDDISQPPTSMDVADLPATDDRSGVIVPWADHYSQHFKSIGPDMLSVLHARFTSSMPNNASMDALDGVTPREADDAPLAIEQVVTDGEEVVQEGTPQEVQLPDHHLLPSSPTELALASQGEVAEYLQIHFRSAGPEHFRQIHARFVSTANSIEGPVTMPLSSVSEVDVPNGQVTSDDGNLTGFYKLDEHPNPDQDQISREERSELISKLGLSPMEAFEAGVRSVLALDCVKCCADSEIVLEQAWMQLQRQVPSTHVAESSQGYQTATPSQSTGDSAELRPSRELAPQSLIQSTGSEALQASAATPKAADVLLPKPPPAGAARRQTRPPVASSCSRRRTVAEMLQQDSKEGPMLRAGSERQLSVSPRAGSKTSVAGTAGRSASKVPPTAPSKAKNTPQKWR